MGSPLLQHCLPTVVQYEYGKGPVEHCFFMGLHLWHGPDYLVFGRYQNNLFFSHIPKIRPLPKKWVKGFIKLEPVVLEESGRLDVAHHADKVIPQNDLK